MNIKSRQIVPLVGLCLCGYLSLSGGMNQPKPGNFSGAVTGLPQVAVYSPSPFPPNIRNPFLDEAQWKARLAALRPVQKDTPKALTVVKKRVVTPVEQKRIQARKAENAREAQLKTMVLSGILSGGQQRTAIIDGNIVTEKDRIGEFLVTSITEDSVHLLDKKGVHVLKLVPLPPPGLFAKIQAGNGNVEPPPAGTTADLGGEASPARPQRRR
jgi:hypothetical protein